MTQTTQLRIHQEELLTGKPVLQEIREDECPRIPEGLLPQYEVLNRLACNPDFAVFLAFARERSLRDLDNLEGQRCPDHTLRAAKLLRQAILEIPPMLRNFFDEVDNLLEARQKWLAEAGETGHNPKTPETNL